MEATGIAFRFLIDWKNGSKYSHHTACRNVEELIERVKALKLRPGQAVDFKFKPEIGTDLCNELIKGFEKEYQIEVTQDIEDSVEITTVQIVKK
jgi:hypothetical protein